jgi:hypothetical protein
MKFAATDLKLYRRQQETAIEHWGVWREQATPRFYFLWAARLEPSRERLETLVSEAQALVNTYLDGAGIFAWQEKRGGGGYEALAVPASAQVTDLDDVLHRIATIIRQAAPTGEPPPPEQASEPAVRPDQLPDDTA